MRLHPGSRSPWGRLSSLPSKHFGTSGRREVARSGRQECLPHTLRSGYRSWSRQASEEVGHASPNGLAAPVIDADGQVAGAIGITALTIHYTRAKLVSIFGPKVLRAATEASENLGSPPKATKTTASYFHYAADSKSSLKSPVCRKNCVCQGISSIIGQQYQTGHDNRVCTHHVREIFSKE